MATQPTKTNDKENIEKYSSGDQVPSDLAYPKTPTIYNEEEFLREEKNHEGQKDHVGLLTQEFWRIPNTMAEFLIVPCTCQSSTFRDFVLSQDFIPFLRSALNFIEHTNGFNDYHSCVVSRSFLLKRPKSKKQGIRPDHILEAARKNGWYLFVVADKRRNKFKVPDGFSALGMDSPIEYSDRNGVKVKLELTQRDICIEENNHARCFLDAKGRSMYVVVMREHFRKQADLTDEQLLAFWRTAIGVLDKHHCSNKDADAFQDIRINVGGFQNVAHLHLKIWMASSAFQAVWGSNENYQVLRRDKVLRKVSCCCT